MYRDLCWGVLTTLLFRHKMWEGVRFCHGAAKKWIERCWEILKPNKFCRTARCEVCSARKSTGLIYNVWGRRFSWTYGVCVSIMRPLEYNSYRHKLPRGGVRPTHALPKQYIRSKNAAQTDDRIVYLVNCISAHLVGYTLHCAMQRKFMYSGVRPVEQSGLHCIGGGDDSSIHYLLTISCPRPIPAVLYIICSVFLCKIYFTWTVGAPSRVWHVARDPSGLLTSSFTPNRRWSHVTHTPHPWLLASAMTQCNVCHNISAVQ